MTVQSIDLSGSTAKTMQFENANEGRSYPFEDDSILRATSGETLPDNVIVDMRLVLPDTSTAFVSSVYLSEHMISVCIRASGQTQRALSVTIRSSELDPYTPYRLEPLTGSTDIGGMISFGNVEFPNVPTTYRFTDGVLKIHDSCISRYTPAALRSFVDDRTGERLTGDVKIRFSSYIETSRSENDITLSLSESGREVLLPSCSRERPINPCGATPVSSINGVRPDDQRRLVIWFH